MIKTVSGINAIAKIVLFLTACNAVSQAAAIGLTDKVFTYRGMSDASAAVAVGDKMFVVADDEDNILRVYETTSSCFPVFSYDLTQFLGIDRQHQEADIEGATTIGDTVYWITSHGRNKDGKMRPNRYRFFAISVKAQVPAVTFDSVGSPSRTLIHSLVKNASRVRLELKKATRFGTSKLSKQERKNLAPKKKGLNIEGLCASPDGKTIYIGFRNPRPYDKSTGIARALVVALNNPKQVVEGGEQLSFGEPVSWDLGGLGIRSMEYSSWHKAYFIVAGPHGESPESSEGRSAAETRLNDTHWVLYRWSGRKNESPVLVREMHLDKDFNPEALVPFQNSPRLLLLSDDGALLVEVSGDSECMDGKLREDGKCLNKHLTNQSKKTFRAIWLEP